MREQRQHRWKLDRTRAHREAAMSTGFMWQDQAAAGETDGVGHVQATTIIGTLPQEVHGSPVYVLEVHGMATSCFGYSYKMEETVTVRLHVAKETSSDEGELRPITAEATEEEIAQAQQHEHDLACQEYADLSHVVEVGAYTEGSNGEYWYGDQDVSQRMIELEKWALEQRLSFQKQPQGYILGPATEEELAAYALAKEQQEEEE